MSFLAASILALTLLLTEISVNNSNSDSFGVIIHILFKTSAGKQTAGAGLTITLTLLSWQKSIIEITV